MKIAIFICLLISTSFSLNAQIFWVENFDGDSTSLAASDYSGTNGYWTMSILGEEGNEPNTWYVSCREAGHIAGACQSFVCGSTPDLGGTLHISFNDASSDDGGALYAEYADWCGHLCTTDRMAESPIINCSGRIGINLHFYYISGSDSEGTWGYAIGSVWYSTDGGTTWSFLAIPPATAHCGSGQSLWSDYRIMLPESANNNPSVKIGFRWSNTDINPNHIGPVGVSFAVDSVSLTAQNSTGIAAINNKANSYWSSQQGNDIIVSSALPVDATLNLAIYNAAGNAVIKDIWTIGETTKQYNGSNLASGLYVIKLTNNNATSVLKLLKR